jgi:hypothetical protein
MFVWVLGCVTLAAVLVSFLIKGRPVFGKAKRTPAMDMKEQVLRNRYFRSIRKGDFARPLARVYSQMDLALIQSLFTARNIASQSLFEITNNMRTGIGVCGYNDIWLVVLNSEYLKAKQTMREYIRNRCRTPVASGSKLRNVFEALLFGWAANPVYRVPELMKLGDADLSNRNRFKRAKTIVRGWGMKS